MAILAMQAPAVTREYQGAHLQLVRSSSEDMAQCRAPHSASTASRSRTKSASSPGCIACKWHHPPSRSPVDEGALSCRAALRGLLSYADPRWLWAFPGSV